MPLPWHLTVLRRPSRPKTQEAAINFRIRLFLFCFLLSAFWLPSSGYAACFNPAGNAGDIRYNGGFGVHQYCNGGAWVSMATIGNTTTGLIGWWKLDDGSGTSASDSSGMGNTGGLTGSPLPTWTTGGMQNGALNFDNVQNYVLVATSASLQFSGAFSASVWLKTTGLSSGGTTDTDFIGNTNWPTQGFLLADEGPTAANIFFRILPSSNGTACATGNACFARSLVNDGAWHNIVGVYDGTNVMIYLDGTLKNTEAGTGGLAISATPYTIGKGSVGTSGSMLIDDARVYNRALTAQDIKTLYTSTGGTSGDINTGEVGYWKFDEGSGTAAADSSGNGNTGTLTNSPTWTGSGKINGALTFTASSSTYVNTATASNFGFARTQPFTLAAWVNRTSAANGDNIMGTTNTAASYQGFYIAMPANGPSGSCGGYTCTSNCVEFDLINSAGTNYVCAAATSTSASAGSWHHIVATYDGSSASTGINIYVDGVAQSSLFMNTTNPLTASPASGLTLKIGAADPSAFFTGTLDDVRIYSRALTASDVLTLYNMTATACASPVGYTGDLRYNGGTNHVMQFCNASNWIPAGPVPGAGGSGCTSPVRNEGDIIYSSDFHLMQYCDGTNWQAMGGIVPVGSGLVGWWNFDEGSGTSAADSYGNGNTGTTHNTPTWTTSGKINGALSFAADSNQYISIPSFADNDTNMTYAFWVYIPSSYTQWGAARILQIGGTSTTTPTNGTSIELNNVCCSNSNKMRIAQWSGGVVTNWDGSVLNYDSWNHVAYVAAGNTVTVYVNGVPQTVTGGPGTRTTGNQPLYVGAGGGEYFDGNLDDVRIYNRALSASEVWKLYLGLP